MDHLDIIKDLKAGNYKPVYFLCGEEPYFIDKVSDYIEDYILDESVKGFDQTVVYGADSNITDIIAAAKRFPMMGEKQVVLVKEAQKLKGLDALVNYLDQPQAQTILAFAYKKKPDGRLAVTKKLKKQAVFLEAKPLYSDKIPAYIQNMAKAKKLSLDPKSAYLIHESVGDNLSRIEKELEKLKIAVGEGAAVLPEHIEEHIGISKEFNTFELQAALAKKDVRKAFRIISFLGANSGSSEAIMTVATLYAYFTKVWKVHVSPDKSQGGIAKFVGVPPFFVKDYQTAAANYSQKALFQIVGHLKDADLKCKGIKPGPEQSKLLEELVFKILHAA